MTTSILGINAYHGDASAALLVDGRLVAAVEEERFNRIKHWAGFPAQSIRYCLEVADMKGMRYNPFTRTTTLTRDMDVNYLIHAQKPLDD